MITLFNDEVDLLDTLFMQRRALNDDEVKTLQLLMTKVKTDKSIRDQGKKLHVQS